MQKFGLFGFPIAHSLSPVLQGNLLKSQNIEGEYQLYPIEPDNLVEEFAKLEKSGLTGLNVTAPFKQDILAFLDEVAPAAKKMGAVNTIFFKDGKKYGYNTDYDGFGMVLDQINFSCEGKKVLILGAGGGALAASHYVANQGAKEVWIVSRNLDKKSHGGFPLLSYDQLAENLGTTDLIVNCTPVGMYPNFDASPIDLNLLDSYKGAVVDLIYNPFKTKLIEKAISLGLAASGGLMMLVGQGIAAQQIWQEKKLDPALAIPAEKLLRKTLEERNAK